MMGIHKNIVLTGEREPRKYCVLISGCRVHVTLSHMAALGDMLQARLTSRTGYSTIPSCDRGSGGGAVHLLIHRLRKRIANLTSVEGLGQEIIQAGDCEYRISLDWNVTVDDGFFELPHDVIDAGVMVELRQLLARQARGKPRERQR